MNAGALCETVTRCRVVHAFAPGGAMPQVCSDQAGTLAILRDIRLAAQSLCPLICRDLLERPRAL